MASRGWNDIDLVHAAISGLVYFFGSGGHVSFSLLCICKRALKGGGGKRMKGERSQCIVTLVPMVFLAVRSAIVWFS